MPIGKAKTLRYVGMTMSKIVANSDGQCQNSENKNGLVFHVAGQQLVRERQVAAMLPLSTRKLQPPLRKAGSNYPAEQLPRRSCLLTTKATVKDGGEPPKPWKP